MKCKSLILLALFTHSAFANPEPFYYAPESASDWDLTCDNAGMCRAVGYHNDSVVDMEKYFPTSILIQRRAGNPEIQIKINLETESLPEEITNKNPIENAEFELFANQKLLGKIKWEKMPIDLNDELFNSIIQSDEIEFHWQNLKWKLSNIGKKEILNKMDEIQKFKGTKSAFLEKGNHPEPTEKFNYPNITIQPIQSSEPQLIEQKSELGKKLIPLLKPNSDEYCFFFNEENNEPFSVYQLDAQKALILALCDRGAYNESFSAWVVDSSFEKIHQHLDGVSYLQNNQLVGAFRGRGIGDCWDLNEYSYNGEIFVQTYEGHHGQCKGFLGGAWQLPSIIVIRNLPLPIQPD